MLTNKNIVKDNDKQIKNISMDVTTPLTLSDELLAKELLEYVLNSRNPEIAEKYELRPAVGIAAIQTGIAKKILAIAYEQTNDQDEIEQIQYLLANAKIISNSVATCYLKAGEGCLSVEGEYEGYVLRSARIKVKAYDILAKKEVIIAAKGYLAIVFQHEIDHFQGTLFYQRINKDNPYYVPKNCLEI